MIVISENKIRKLCMYRERLGSPTFFKVFRAFYKLCQLSHETQNNPFALFMDRQSCIRGFGLAFGVNVRFPGMMEIASRFFNLFTISEEEIMIKTSDTYSPKQDRRVYPERAHQVGLLRWFKVILLLLDVDNEDHRQMHLRLMFLFYDYDCNGSIGSVDVASLIRGESK